MKSVPVAEIERVIDDLEWMIEQTPEETEYKKGIRNGLEYGLQRLKELLP